MPQIKFGLAPAGSAADLEEEDPAWATRVLRFDPEYKFALAEAMGVQPQLSRRKMPTTGSAAAALAAAAVAAAALAAAAVAGATQRCMWGQQRSPRGGS
jgi:uncharacterized protein YfaQ (DUF2300 family)